MRNKFPGICYRCNKKVEPKQGHFELVPPKLRHKFTFRWFLQHADCAIKYRGTNHGVKHEQI